VGAQKVREPVRSRCQSRRAVWSDREKKGGEGDGDGGPAQAHSGSGTRKREGEGRGEKLARAAFRAPLDGKGKRKKKKGKEKEKVDFGGRGPRARKRGGRRPNPKNPVPRSVTVEGGPADGGKKGKKKITMVRVAMLLHQKKKRGGFLNPCRLDQEGKGRRKTPSSVNTLQERKK